MIDKAYLETRIAELDRKIKANEKSEEWILVALMLSQKQMLEKMLPDA